MSNKTREEILLEEYGKLIANPEKVYAQNPSIIKAAHEAMSIYAKQQSISFAEWVDRDYCQCDKNSKNKDLWYKIGQIEKGRYSTEELYNLFLQDQNKDK